MVDLFISPHPDDIAYSCYGRWHDSLYQKKLLTVFSSSCYAYDSVCVGQCKKISAERQQEDLKFAQMGEAMLTHLDFEDSSMRKNIYIDSSDIYHLLCEEILKTGPCNIYAPLSITWHHDHIIVRHSVFRYLHEHTHDGDVFLYEDLPYVCDYLKEQYLEEITRISESLHYVFQPIYISLNQNIQRWKHIVKEVYKSQFNQKEYLKMLQYKRSINGYTERLWKLQK